MSVAGFRKVKTAEELRKPGAAVSERNTGRRVYFNSDASYSINLDSYSAAVNRGLSEAAKSVARKGSDDGFEHLRLVDLASGKNVFYETDESFSSVGYAFRDYIKNSPGRTFAFVHNHNTDGSFSETDLRTLLHTKEIAVMIAVRNDGIIYIAERDGDALQYSNFDAICEEDLKPLRDMLKHGTITMSQRTRRREEIIVINLLRDYTKGKGLLEYGEKP